jgi:competence protein ComEC
MQDTVLITKRALLLSVMLSFLIVSGLFLYQSFYRRSFIVFCDVGQGDAAYIRLEGGYDIIVDAGQSKDALSCLGKYMPFHDKTIELAIISHPHFDHYGGFIFMKDRYEIKSFVLSPLVNENKSYTELMQWIQKEGVISDVAEKDLQMILPNNVVIDFLWPPLHFSSQDMNAGSLVFVLRVGDMDILFTGDAGPDILRQITDDPALTVNNIEILKVPHHGSKNGLTKEFLERVSPEKSIISVGVKNKFGHPSKEIIEMFQDSNYSVLTTAQEGNIFINLE